MVHLVVPLMIAGSLPFALTLMTKVGVFGRRDNHTTRNWQANLTGWRQRAYWAHQNAFETYPLFAAAAIVAHLSNPNDSLVIGLSWAFPALRIVYSAMYIADHARARSLVWFLATGCIIALFITALTR